MKQIKMIKEKTPEQIKKDCLEFWKKMDKSYFMFRKEIKKR
jgi:hypothetical protein